jgi:hypothetical protein
MPISAGLLMCGSAAVGGLDHCGRVWAIGWGCIDDAIEFGAPQQREAIVTELNIVPLLSRGVHTHHRSYCACWQLLWITHRDMIADLEARRSHYHALRLQRRDRYTWWRPWLNYTIPTLSAVVSSVAV